MPKKKPSWKHAWKQRAKNAIILTAYALAFTTLAITSTAFALQP